MEEQSAASCEIAYKHNLRWKNSLASIVPGVVELICGLGLLIGCWVAVQERLEGHVVACGLNLHLMVAHEWHVGHLHGGRYFAMRREGADSLSAQEEQYQYAHHTKISGREKIWDAHAGGVDGVGDEASKGVPARLVCCYCVTLWRSWLRFVVDVAHRRVVDCVGAALCAVIIGIGHICMHDLA